MARGGCTSGVLFEELLDGSYDCVDRVVLRAYYQFAQRGAGLRAWWRIWKGSDVGLDNTRLMRVAGRFARRVKGWAKSQGVPIVYSKRAVRSFTHRAVGALYVDKEFTIAGRETETGVLELWATHPERGVAMSATAETAP